MSEGFDPYYEWLGIPPKDQPPNHYRLLGIELFEDNDNVIDRAADRQMGHLRTFQNGKHAKESQRLLNELSVAKLCLLHPDRRSAYNDDLRAKMDAAAAMFADSDPQIDPPLSSGGVSSPQPGLEPSATVRPSPKRDRTSDDARSRRRQSVLKHPAFLVSAGVLLGMGVLFAVASTLFTVDQPPVIDRSPPRVVQNEPADATDRDDPQNDSLPTDSPRIDPSDAERPIPNLPPDPGQAPPRVASGPFLPPGGDAPRSMPFAPMRPLNEAERRVPDPPQRVANNRVPPSFTRQLDSASGMVTERFALCHQVAINQGIMRIQQMRMFGFRPIRFRPYAGSNRLDAAILWKRDGLPFRIVAGVDANTIKAAHERLADEGFEAVDLAGIDGPIRHFVGIWAKTDEVRRSEISVGESAAEVQARSSVWRSAGLVAHSSQLFVSQAGDQVYCKVWKPMPGGATSSEYIQRALNSFEASPSPDADFLDVSMTRLPNGGIQVGACVVRGPDATVTSTVLPTGDHLARCREFEQRGFEPVALAVADHDGALRCVSVWRARAPSTDIVTTQDDTKTVTASATHAIRFGGHEYVEIRDTEWMTERDRAFTVESWLRLLPNPSNPPACLMGNGAIKRGSGPDPGMTGWFLIARNVNASALTGGSFELRTGQGSGGSSVFFRSATRRLGEDWHHVAFCSEPLAGDTSMQRVFLDGKSVISRVFPTAEVAPAPIRFCLGASPSKTTPAMRFEGDIKALRISSTVRYKQTFDPPERFERDGETEVLLDFSAKAPALVQDISGRLRHGTVGGATWVSADSEATAVDTRPDPAIIAAEPAARLKAPAGTELQAATLRVKDVFQSELAAADDPSALVKLAITMIERAADEADSAVCYALLLEAKDLAVKAVDLHATLRAIDEIEDRFDVPTWPIKADAIAGLSSEAKTDPGLLQLISTEAFDMVDRAMGDGDFKSAERMLNTLQQVGLRLRDAALRRRVLAIKKELSSARELWTAAKAARDALEDDQEDPDANLVWGKYLCFAREDWVAGLPYLIEGGDRELARLAEDDLKKPIEANEQLELANDWYEWAEAATGSDERGGFVRAQHWYGEAAPQVSGLDNALARNRLQELAKKIAPRIGRGSVQLSWLNGPVGEIQQLTGHTAAITHAAVTRSGRYAVSAGQDDTVRVWDLSSGEEVGSIKSTMSQINTLVIAPNDKHVIVGGNSSTIEVWDLASGRPASGMKGDSYVSFMDVSTGRRPVLLMGKSTTGDHLALFDIGGRPILPLKVPSAPVSVDLSPSGRYVAVANNVNQVFVWDLRQKRLLDPFQGITDRILDVAISPDEQMVAACVQHDIFIWDLNSRQEKKMHATEFTYRIDFAPDNRRLISTSGLAEVSVWDVQTATPLQKLTGEGTSRSTSSTTVAVSYLPDARGAISGGYDRILRVWRLPD